MTPAEAAALLTVAAAFDNRKPDADQARAWAMALDGYRFEDCREAILEHYRTSRDWMMPIDVIARVRKLRNDRITAYGLLPDPPADIDPDDTEAIQRWRRNLIRAIANGEVVTDEPVLEVGPMGREEAKSRVDEIRAELAARRPAAEPGRPTFDELAAAAASRDDAIHHPDPRPEQRTSGRVAEHEESK